MGSSVGKIEGTVLGTILGTSDMSVGTNVGSLLGTWDGISVGTSVGGSSIVGAAVSTIEYVGSVVVSTICDVGGGELLFTLDPKGVGDGEVTMETVGDEVSG